jgi:uncharacterized delta-60 repeat protein
MTHLRRRLAGPACATALAVGLIVLPMSSGAVHALAAGDLDLSLGGTGYVTDVGYHEQGYGVAVQNDGRIIVGGQLIETDDSDFRLVRYNADGSPDTSFGDHGSVVWDLSRGDIITAIALATDGKIVVGGRFYSIPGTSAEGFVVARLLPTGEFDDTFGTGGVATRTFANSNAVWDLAVQPDGKVIAAGDGVLTRFNEDGSTDSSFGNAGTAILDPPMDIASVTLQSDGGVIVGGAPLGSYTFILERFGSDGETDPAFGGTGSVTTSFGTGSEFLSDVLVRDDDRVVAVGYYTNTSPRYADFAVAQYLPDGSPDQAFGGAGLVLTHMTVGDYPVGAAIQPDGRLVVGAAVATAFTSTSDIGLVRYNTDGTLDLSFGLGGKVLANLGRLEFPEDLALQPDGRLVVGGTSTSNVSRTDAAFQVARFIMSSDSASPAVVGVPDRNPNTGGWYAGAVTIDWQATDDSGTASDPSDTAAATEGAHTYISDPSCDPSGNCATGEVTLSIDMTDPDLTCQPAVFLLNEPGATVSATVTDTTSGPVSTTVAVPIDTTLAGARSASLTGHDRAGRSRTVSCPYSVGYRFDGFFQPVDNMPAVNLSQAGRAVPLKWRLTDYAGNAVADPASFVSVTSYATACDAGTEPDAIETYTGASGLQYLEDGYWQYNWATPKAYAGKCRTVSLNLSDGGTGRIATFRFR